ncbi:hypothetical protein F5148DRAFT_1152284 [Russula earlei]|uniref:Uncharacterized protein n=1 Tax=Russula earlei TaxID=71964 RepID=A0ACC0TXV8_9AGAM|nr:hypothetical protein F5148DRAFT_1152284 [Russula earlei]
MRISAFALFCLAVGIAPSVARLLENPKSDQNRQSSSGSNHAAGNKNPPSYENRARCSAGVRKEDQDFAEMLNGMGYSLSYSGPSQASVAGKRYLKIAPAN